MDNCKDFFYSSFTILYSFRQMLSLLPVIFLETRAG